MTVDCADHSLCILLRPAGSNLFWSLLSLQRPTPCPSCFSIVPPTNLPGHGQHLEGTQAQDSCSTTLPVLEHLQLASQQPPSDGFPVHPGCAFYEPHRRSICDHPKRRCNGGRHRCHLSRQDPLLLSRGPHPDEQRATVDGCLSLE